MGSEISSESGTSLVYNNLGEDRTSWDDLSNELVLEIFDYLSFMDIYMSFSNLNIRFNNLIESYPHHFNLQSSQILPNHIRSLKLIQKYQLPIFFSLDQTRLLSLRAISLSNLRSDQILSVFKDIELKQLEYIYVSACANNGDDIKLIIDIQTQILSLGEYKLKRCHLKDRLIVPINDLPETLSSLNYLQVVACENFNILSQLISRMPNLNYIQASIQHSTESISLSFSNRIKHLILRPHSTCSTKEFETFLKNCCSSLERLIIEFQTYTNEQFKITFNKYQWLTISPPQLKYFHLKMLPHPSNHTTNVLDFQKLPLREKILLYSNNQQEHYCKVIIDQPFIDIWENKLEK